MTKSKNTKRALLASVLSILMCVAMLVGSTFAWFTDSVKSGNNKIVAGNLNVDLVHVVNGEDVSIKENPDHLIFDYDKWEPGFTAVETLKVVNKGALAFEFRLDAAAVGATVGPEGEKLAEAIDVYVYSGKDVTTTKSFKDMTEENGWRKAGTLAELMADQDGIAYGVLLPEGAVSEDNEPVKEIAMTVALHMQESAGNGYQGLSLGELSFMLNAKQYTYERDSFGKDYDKNTKYPITFAINNAINKGAADSNALIAEKIGEGIIYFDNALRTDTDGAQAITLHFTDEAFVGDKYKEAIFAVTGLIYKAVNEEAANIYSVEIGHGRFSDDTNVRVFNGKPIEDEGWVEWDLLAMVDTYGDLVDAFYAATNEGLNVMITDIEGVPHLYRMYFDLPEGIIG